jgi:hypothetical protein
VACETSYTWTDCWPVGLEGLGPGEGVIGFFNMPFGGKDPETERKVGGCWGNVVSVETLYMIQACVDNQED